ncbi:MAG: hypothetical protein RLZZ283_364 [Candidatus Parcubacteria bacterium]|jgi:hypothetical protein
MNFKEFWTRELYVAKHGQSWRFRTVKYLLLLAFFAGMYVLGGWRVVGYTLATLFILSIAIHFLFRWKTDAWTTSWGPYKKLTLPSDG